MTTAPAPAEPTRVTKRRAQTRARLLDAAYAVFAEKGFGRVRIEDVCTAAGYTRGAFYSQFDSLEAMFFTLYDDRAERIAAQVAAAVGEVDEHLDLDAILRRIASTLLLDRDWLLVKTDFLMYAARHPEVATRLIDHRGRLRATIEGQLAALGARLPGTLITPRDAARAVIAAYDGVTVQLLLDRDPAAARTWLHQLLTALLGPTVGADPSEPRP